MAPESRAVGVLRDDGLPRARLRVDRQLLPVRQRRLCVHRLPRVRVGDARRLVRAALRLAGARLQPAHRQAIGLLRAGRGLCVEPERVLCTPV